MKSNDRPSEQIPRESEIEHLALQLLAHAGPTFPESGDKSGFGAEEEFPPSTDRSGTIGAE